MNTQGRQAGSFGDELTNMLMIALVGVVGLALVLRFAGTIAAFLTGANPPDAPITGGISVLPNLAHPGAELVSENLNPSAYWIVAAVLLAALAALGAWVWTLRRRHSRKVETDPRKLAGTTTAHEVAIAASARALLRRSAMLRPSLTAPTAADIGYRLGRSRGKGVWASVEDSILLIGPTRSGRTCTS